MNSFNQDFLNRQADRNDLGAVVHRQASTIKQVSQAFVRMQSLDEVADRIGELDYRVVAPNGIVRMVMSAVSLEDEFGINANFAAFDANGVVQFYVDADDGAVYAAQGDIVLDQFGLLIKNSTTSGLHFEDNAGGRDKIHIVADGNNDFEFVNIATATPGTISFFMKNTSGVTARLLHMRRHPVNSDEFEIDFGGGGGRVGFGTDHFIDYLPSSGVGSATVWFNERGHNINVVIKDEANARLLETVASTSRVLVHGAPLADVIGTFLGNVTVPASTTYHSCPWKTTADATSSNFPWPEGGTLADLTIRLANAQPASGSLVVTLYVNNSATALTITIPAGSASGTYSDTTHTVAISSTDLLRWVIQNNATGASAQLANIAMKLIK